MKSSTHRRITLLFFLSFSFLSFGQYFGPEMADTVISKKKVKTCKEYDVEDSINFFMYYPNAYYWKYNEKGQIIQQNGYDEGEFTVQFVYDNLGRKRVTLWSDSSTKQAVRRIRIEEYDSLGKHIGYRDFSGTEPYNEAYSIHKIKPNLHLTDTLITGNTTEYITYENTDNLDTLNHTFIYQQKGKIDSVLTFFPANTAYNFVEIIYTYDEDGKLLKREKITKAKAYDYIVISYFNAAGLPYEKWYISKRNKQESVLKTCLVYTYHP